ncbi:hypothetical protein BJF93_13980 [Xaviernesmea oryzae]|uniref:Uncharacterized protein n=2 Tax=Xaviernesmea oryzae TaxID=464029 RepID=A0A1Q9ARE0_9HYPH|nr:hypothetical protein BJF93_13980 [Xaviernesmea oryzae]SEL29850.1 hypothetical protein SAMN04487976_10768 [Xaviernesmea oryzae]
MTETQREGGDAPFLEARIAALEEKMDAAALSAEALHRDLLISEVKQRIRVRYFTVGIAVTVIVFMAAAMMHAAHHYFWGAFVLIPPAVAIAMFVAPLVSITTVTIMLLIGAFRRFKDDDMDNINVASITAEALKGATAR